MTQIGRNYINIENERVARKGKHVFANIVRNPQDVSWFIRHVSNVFHNPETKQVSLHFNNEFEIFPNVYTPIASIVDYYVCKNKKIVIHGERELFDKAHVFSPLIASPENIKANSDPSKIVWKVTSSTEILNLLDCVIEFIKRKMICEKDVMFGVEWSLYEILDNVFQHSKAGVGYFMCRLYPRDKRISFCIADAGIGILNSFSKSEKYNPKSPVDAITIAVKEGVTSSEEGQGNGLWGVLEIISYNQGQLTVTSSGGAIYYNQETGKVTVFDKLPRFDRENGGTIVDIQINIDTAIDMSEALKTSRVNLRLEEIEDDAGNVIVKVKEKSEGTGTRDSGKKLNVYIRNLLNESSGILVLDFEGVGVVSSSFADEVVGKLYVILGKKKFGNRIRFKNLCEPVRLIINKSAWLRS